MNKMVFILILVLPNLIFSQDKTSTDLITSIIETTEITDTKTETTKEMEPTARTCLEENNGTRKLLSECTAYNKDANEIHGKIDKNFAYCCLLSIKYKNESENSYCLTVEKSNKDSIEERIQMFKYQKNVDKVSIDCSNNYLFISLLLLLIALII